jgi:hypothetical protein
VETNTAVTSGGFGECRGARRIQIGYREKSDGRVFGGQPRAQRADATGADDGDAEFFACFQRGSSWCDNAERCLPLF